jgi:hypothetical protein
MCSNNLLKLNNSQQLVVHQHHLHLPEHKAMHHQAGHHLRMLHPWELHRRLRLHLELLLLHLLLPVLLLLGLL